jgi:hypothetical protein
LSRTRGGTFRAIVAIALLAVVLDLVWKHVRPAPAAPDAPLVSEEKV